VVPARAEGGTACGPRAPRALAGVLWKGADGRRWLLAAGSDQVASISVTGGVRGQAPGRLLSLPAKVGDRAELAGRLVNGRKIGALG
jgi:hypothetical protein